MGYAAVFIAAALLLCYEIDEPFIGQHDSGSAAMANYARNMIRYGYWGCKMGQIINSGPLDKADRIYYYLHCAPLQSFLVSVSFRLFGVHEWSTRLAPIAQAIGCVVLTMLIAERLWGAGIALAASCFLVVSPVFAYYGRVADLVPFGFGYPLLSLYAYLRWFDSQARAWLAMLLGAALAGVLASLEVWSFPFVLTAHYYLAAKRRSKAVLLLPMMTFLGFALLAGHMVLLTGFDNMVTDAFDALGRRSMFKNGGANFVSAVAKQAAWAVEYVTPVPLLLALVWAVLAAAKWLRRRRSRQGASQARFADSVIVVLLANPVLISLVFPEHSANHEFSLYGPMPGIAMASALGLAAVWRRLSRAGSGEGARARRAFAWTVCSLIVCIFLANSLTNWLRVHRKRFYSPWFEFAHQLNAMTQFDEGITMNVRDPHGYPGYYLPFYLDRRVAWGVGSIEDARKKLCDGRARYELAVFFVRDPVTDKVRMATFRRDDLPGQPSARGPAR